MIRTKCQGRFDIDDRITRQHAGAHRFTQAFLHRRNVLAWHHAAFRCVFKHKAAPRRQRFEGQHNMTILPFPAGLTDKFTFHLFHRFTQCFAVGDLWTADIRLNAKLTLHPVDDNFQVQFAHPGNNCLSGLFIRMQTERGILRGQAL